MKAVIKSTKFIKEYEAKFGILYLHSVKYGDKEGLYSSKSKDQKKFVAGKEAEFTEEEREGKNGKKYFVIKPSQAGQFSNFNKAVNREQSKYSGFAMSYAKDLLVANKIEGIPQMYLEAQCMMDWMVEQDNILKK